MNFSINRVSNLIRRDLTYAKKPLLIIGFIFLAISLLFLFLNQDHFWHTWWERLLLIFGAGFFTQSIFLEFRDSQQKQQYLNLPATTFEKWCSRWVFSAVIIPLFITAVCVLFHLMAGGDLTHFFQSSHRNLLVTFVILNAWIFLCAATFDKPIIGVAYSLGGLFLFLLIGSMIFLVIFWKYSSGMSINSNSFTMSTEFVESIGPNILKILRYGCLIVLPPLFYLISYYKLKEQEA